MTTNSNRHIITNKIMWIRQIFLYVAFLSTSDILVVFNISSSHGSTNLPNQCFIAWTVLSISQLYVLGFHIFKRFSYVFMNSNYLILFAHTNIHHDFIFALNYIHFYSVHSYTHTIHVELKILFQINPTLN